MRLKTYFDRVEPSDIRSFSNDVLRSPSSRQIINLVRASDAPVNPGARRGARGVNPATYGLCVGGGSSEGPREGVSEDGYLVLGERSPRIYSRGSFAPRAPRWCGADDTPITWELPGHGERSRDTCGRSHGIATCENFHYVAPRRWFCDKSTCPDCFEQWTLTHSNTPYQKLMAARQKLVGIEYEFTHLVVSPPPSSFDDFATLGGTKKMYENFARVLDHFGVHGVGVLHLWRSDDLNDSTAEVYEDFAESAGGLSWRPGPHMHVIGLCDPQLIRDISEGFFKKTGWVVSVINDTEMTPDYLHASLTYLLSHASVGHYEKNGHKTSIQTLRYFGILNPSKMARFDRPESAKKNDPRVDLREAASHYCADCEGSIYDYEEWLKYGDDEQKPIKAVLHHAIYCLREELPGLRILTYGMTKSEVISFAQNNAHMAVVFDDRSLAFGSPAERFSQAAGGPEYERVPRWSRPADVGGQLSIMDGDNWEVSRACRCCSPRLGIPRVAVGARAPEYAEHPPVGTLSASDDLPTISPRSPSRSPHDLREDPPTWGDLRGLRAPRRALHPCEYVGDSFDDD